MALLHLLPSRKFRITFLKSRAWGLLAVLQNCDAMSHCCLSIAVPDSLKILEVFINLFLLVFFIRQWKESWICTRNSQGILVQFGKFFAHSPLNEAISIRKDFLCKLCPNAIPVCIISTYKPKKQILHIFHLLKHLLEFLDSWKIKLKNVIRNSVLNAKRKFKRL